jgi:hypothetical protein
MSATTINQQLKHPFSLQQELASKAFETHIPRIYSDEWMRLTTGAIDFGWDRNAIQCGYLDLVYRYFDLFPQRLGPVLTSLLLQEEKYDPVSVGYCLAATEIYHLSSLMLLRDTDLPMPVHVTLVYTARQFSPILIGLQRDVLTDAARTWLIYEFSRSFSLQEIQFAVNRWTDLHEKEWTDPHEYWAYKYNTSNVRVFNLAIDIAMAVLNQRDAAYVHELQSAATRLAGIYTLILDIMENPFSYDTSPSGAILREAAITNRDSSWLSAGLDKIANELKGIGDGLSAIPSGLASAFWNFTVNLIEPEIHKIRKEIYAKYL